ncbi:hypothetical protein [Mucilaginibacter sp.]|uniref:hypothetical protein n=1 Tax=Mucilaginibacter sp. TaxID=1882438 RepID=UPI00263907E6|nr:hypothetical protein [Mucilaginibacter sp.]MDB5030130.1 hypothetical protein [Mucilaginibacter sp.]
MKKILFIAIALFLCAHCMAQEQLAFPFQGGKEVMTRFFKDSLVVSPAIVQKKAAGLAIFKFTADEKGAIRKIIIYYADDLLLTQPIIEALKKSNYKWIIPDHEKFHDFILPFTIGFNSPAVGNAALQKAVYNFYTHRKPVLTYNQVPLDMATLLPTVVVNYDLVP